jgi:hypothetical protein
MKIMLPKILDENDQDNQNEVIQLLASFGNSAPSTIKTSKKLQPHKTYKIPKLNMEVKILTEHDDNYHISINLVS